MLYRPMFCSWPDETEGKPFRATMTHNTFLAEAGRSTWPVGFQIEKKADASRQTVQLGAESSYEVLEETRCKESRWV